MKPVLFFIIVLMVCHEYACGQGFKRPIVYNFDKMSYKAANQNWSVAENDEGIVYFGNNSGLLEYDGSNWFLYKMPENLVVRSVAIGPNNEVFVGGYEEFGFWEKSISGQLEYVSLSDSISEEKYHNDEIWRIVSKDGNTYFQSFSSMYVYDGSHVEKVTLPSNVVLLLEAGDRMFIHSIGRGLFEIDDKKHTLIPGSEFLADDEVKVVLPLEGDQLLIGASQGGLFVFDGSDFIPIKTEVADLIKSAEINVGVATGNYLILGTIGDGIFLLDRQGRLIDHLNKNNFLQNNTVLSLGTDSDGNVWAGLDHGIALVRLNDLFDYYISPVINIGSSYTATFYNDDLYVGTNQGLFKFDTNSTGTYHSPQIIKNSRGQVWNLFVTDHNELLCGHTNGTYYLKGDSLVKISEMNGGFNIKEFEDEGNKCLLQSTYNLFVRYDDLPVSEMAVVDVANFNEPIPNFEIDYQNNIWASHLKKGMFRFNLNTQLDSVINVKIMGRQNGFPLNSNIRVSKVENQIVFTTEESIYTYDYLNDSIVPFEKLNEQLGEFGSVRSIKYAGNDDYWFLTPDVIALFHIENKVAERLFYYDLSMQAESIVDEHPNIVTLNDSLHLICLENGFALFNQKEVRSQQSEPRVFVRKMEVANDNGDHMNFTFDNEGEGIKIGSEYENTSFTFMASSHYPFSKFRYMLDGLELGYSEWSQQSEVEYSRLPPGDYQLKVQTKGIYGYISEAKTISFSILKPWYRSNYIYAFGTMALMCGLIFANKKSHNNIKRKALQKVHEESEKRKKEQLLEEQKYVSLKNDKLKDEISHKNMQLANYTMATVNKNNFLIQLSGDIKELKEELGNRFPNYYFNNLRKKIEKNITSDNEWEIFETYFDQAHEDFFKRLISQYPELTQSDLKLCAYLRMNLSSKEIAPLLNISVRSIEVGRYRLRKRLHMKKDENLVEFILNF